MIAFDSRNKFYKSAVRAVSLGEKVKFNIVVPRFFGCHESLLCVKRDGGDYQKQGMFWAGMNGGDCENWDITFSANEAGLYFYHFELRTNAGVKYVSRSFRGEGVITDEINDFRQTVYDRSKLPGSSLEGGIIYQIFPDRFCFSGAKKKNVPSDRLLRKDWGGVPEYMPDENGKVLNRDYFCGDLRGIEEKLDYVKSLGATHIYLNPIFEAHSSHRYNTANFEKIDPLLGDEMDFESLCKSANEKGIIIILDGVFSHVGSDSVYFNREGRYGDSGAYRDENSPYKSWFKMRENGKYDCWWGIDTLPEIREESKEYIEFIKKIIKKWMALGAGGWRLDVADELPDVFLDSVYSAVKDVDSGAPVILEVWENASDKISYGVRRRYLLGGQADSVMNYPFSNAILDFVRHGDGNKFIDSVMDIIETYPSEILNSLMNHLSNHDTPRFITAAGNEPVEGRESQAAHPPLSGYDYDRAKELLKFGAIIQYSLPGVPTVYYGDEAGAQGYADPFNRGCFPWGGEDRELIEFYRSLGRIRRKINMPVREFESVAAGDGHICFLCKSENSALICAANLGGEEISVLLPDYSDSAEAQIFAGSSPILTDLLLRIPPRSAAILSAQI